MVKKAELVEGEYYVMSRYGVCLYIGEKFLNNKGLFHCFIFDKGSPYYAQDGELNGFYRYNWTGDKPPKLNSLFNNKSWKKKKQKSLTEIKETAEKLIDLSIKRRKSQGRKYNIQNLLQEFNSLLPFTLTGGQIMAIGDINKDVKNGSISNRMIVGGCGSGKTVVLQYCMFIAYKNKFQTVLLCPSTILAQQHYNDSIELFKRYDMNIKLLTSKTTLKNKELIYKGLKSGDIDVVIATTSICKKEIEYENLNMFLIDEPQKQGVKAKTFIKNMQLNVNTIQATATPMPRDFLEIESGAMDISEIKTYPQNKKPIITNIIHYNSGNIKRIIQFELERGGRIYFVYNNVSGLDIIKEKLLELLPNLRITIIHGKMKQKDVDNNLLKFKNGKFDLLLTTTIIETGINININMMLIYHPELLGLTQLLQIKNRIGRFGEQSYCFLVEPNGKKITDAGKERLKTICKYNKLGQDLEVAKADRNIRGSGRLFGYEQSGRMISIGMDMYNELLKQEIQRRKKEIS